MPLLGKTQKIYQHRSSMVSQRFSSVSWGRLMSLPGFPRSDITTLPVLSPIFHWLHSNSFSTILILLKRNLKWTCLVHWYGNVDECRCMSNTSSYKLEGSNKWINCLTARSTSLIWIFCPLHPFRFHVMVQQCLGFSFFKNAWGHREYNRSDC